MPWSKIHCTWVRERKFLKKISDTLFQWVGRRDFPCAVSVALPATHGFGLWPKICRRGRTEAFLLKGVKTSPSQCTMRPVSNGYDWKRWPWYQKSFMFSGVGQCWSVHYFIFATKRPNNMTIKKQWPLTCILLGKYYWVFATFFDEFYSMLFLLVYLFPSPLITEIFSLSGPQLSELNYKLLLAGQKHLRWIPNVCLFLLLYGSF